MEKAQSLKSSRCLCPVEGVEKDFRGAAIIGHYSGKNQTPTSASSTDLKIWSSKPTTANFVFSIIISGETGANNPKIG